jgi:hypothetical protein
MITVAQCMNLAEALRFKTLLEAHGIPTFIPDETTASIAPHHFMTPSGVRVQVPDDRADEAKQLIADDRPE